MIDFKSINEIVGEKVILRRQRASDVDFFVKWYNDKEVAAKCGFEEEFTREEFLNGMEHPKDDATWYTITDKTGNIVGETGLLRIFPTWRQTDMTIIVPNPVDRGKGYGTEAVKLMFELAFDKMDMHRISIGVVGFNEPALKFYDKIGFKREGLLQDGYLYEGKFYDFVMMRILKPEYDAAKKRV